MVVGVTGGIGSGKSTVVRLFSELGDVAVYIADEEAKKLMNTSEEIREKLIKVFSSEAYINKELNRPFIAGIVFNDKDKLAVLNSIVHPVVKNHLQDFIVKNQNKDYVLYENAILFENGSNEICDKIVTVTAPKELKIERVIKRDKTTREEVLRRMSSQWSDAKKMLQSNYIIENIKLIETQKKVKLVHNKIIYL